MNISTYYLKEISDMLKYIVQTNEMNEIMGLLYRVLDIRITFFDLQGGELEGFNIKEISPFCNENRKNPETRERCIACDRENLETARKTRKIHIYHCHTGLLEGMIPLYDKHRKYLGSIVFGQLRDKELDYKDLGYSEDSLIFRNRESTEKEMHDIGALLKYLSEYISENEIIKNNNKDWAEKIEDFIGANLTKKITLNMLAEAAAKSSSFLSHNFPDEFGMPLKAYMREKKMKEALKLLESGKSVRETAYELGYYDEFHFSKEFKRHFGETPSKYKEK